MGRRSVTAVAAFVACAAAAFYVAMLAGCYAHEVLGHGLVALAAGGRFEEFSVSADAHGWALYAGVPDRLHSIPLWGGIAVNLVLGVAGIALLRLRAFPSTHAQLALTAGAVANGGQALGYSLQGALAGNGDAAALHSGLHGPSHTVVVLLLALSYLALLDWAVRRILPWIDGQFGASDVRTRRLWFLLGILAPLAVLVAVRPASVVFRPVVDGASRAAVVGVVASLGVVRSATVRLVPVAAPPFGWRGALAWVALAGVLALVATTFTKEGVRLVGRVGGGAATGSASVGLAAGAMDRRAAESHRSRLTSARHRRANCRSCENFT